MKRKLLFLAITWLGLFAGLELLVRVGIFVGSIGQEPKQHLSGPTLDGKPLRYIPHPFFSYTLNPEHPEHSPQHFREANIFPPDHQTYRIVCLGGSSTYGTSVTRDQSYPQQLHQIIAAKYGDQIEVINAGVGAYTTPHILSLLSLRILDLRPQVCLFYLGFNDAWNRLEFDDFKPDYTHAMKHWEIPAHIMSYWRHSQLLNQISKLTGHNVYQDLHIHKFCWKKGSPDQDRNWKESSNEPFKRNIKSIVALCRANNIRPIFCTQAYSTERMTKWRHAHLRLPAMIAMTDAIHQTAEKLQFEVIDVQTAMNGHPEFFADFIHMSAAGNRRRAEVIAEYLLKHKVIPTTFIEGASLH